MSYIRHTNSLHMLSSCCLSEQASHSTRVAFSWIPHQGGPSKATEGKSLAFSQLISEDMDISIPTTRN